MARVLLVGNGPPARGGIPTFLRLLVEGELAVRHELEFLNLSEADAGGRVRRLSVENVRRTLAHARQVWGRARGVDVVHLHTSLGPVVTTGRAGLLALAGRLRGARVLLHAHGGYLELVGTSWKHRIAIRVLLAPVHHVVAVAESTRRVLAGALPGTPVTKIENGIVTADFEGVGAPPPSPPRVLYAGFLTPRKGLLELLEASGRLVERGVEHRLVVVGAAPEDEAASAEVVRRAAPPSVELVGPVPAEHMPARFREAAVFCLPSWWEAMPISVLEAMAAGVPVVASRVGDIPAMVLDGETGVLVEPRDVDGLTDALGRLLTDPALRAAMGRAGAARARERYDIARTVAALDEVIEAEAGRRSAARSVRWGAGRRARRS